VHRIMILGTALALLIAAIGAQEKASTDTAKAAKSRKKLKEKVSADYENSPIRDVEADLKSQIEGLPLRIDFKGGVSGNITITYKADKKTLEEVLGGICKKNGGLGYHVVSKEGNAEDGTILITNRPAERGYPTADEATRETNKNKGKADDSKTAGKDKNKTKEKAEAKEKKTVKDKAEATEKTEDDGEKLEQEAARKLKFAQTLMEDGKTEKARTRFEEIIAKYPKTKAAAEAKELLKKLDK
jgi:hypothetical protein